MGCLISIDFKKKVADREEALAVLSKYHRRLYLRSEVMAEEEIYGRLRLKIYIPLTENEASKCCVELLSKTPNIEIAKLIC